MQRRNFLRHAGALAGTAALGQMGVFASRAQAADNYKALVCVFLAGGNDTNNMVVPIDTAGYANYAQLRNYLALPQAQLLPLQEPGGVLRYGFHPALPGLQSLWSAGNLAVVANVGTLVQPLTQAQYLSSAAQKPATLFSHIDQQHEWQSSICTTSSSSGWGGRLTDQLAALNVNTSVPAMISTAGNNLFVTGAASQALVIPTSGSFGLSGFSTSSGDAARRSALVSLLGVDQDADLTLAAQDVMTGALSSSATLNPILTSTSSTSAQYFTGLMTSIAAQLLAIAKVIEARSTLGAQRQVFLVSLGSFDTHTNELNTQQSLLSQLDPALTAFHAAMAAIGAGSDVTSFTLSDFSRTFAPNTGGGSDHAWGSHHLVIGDAVHGGQVYGTMPTLSLGGPDDAGQGRWIPTIAVDQYAATLASWFGANAAALATVLPNLAAFSPSTLNFV
ncbi:MAG TPA: DUF1501 domain-containing protein [Steroidobacteraceae bacterium]